MNRIFLMVLLFAFPLAAQEPENAVKCRFLTLGFGQHLPQELYATGIDGNRVKLEISENSNSGMVTLLKSGNKLSFYKSIDAESDQNPVTITTLGGTMREILILIMPVGNLGNKLNTVVFDVGENNLKDGSSVVLNISNQDVRFTIGDKNILLNPGKKTIVDKPQKLDKFNMANVMFQFNVEGRWKTIYKSMINFPMNRRILFVTYIDPATTRHRARIFNL